MAWSFLNNCFCLDILQNALPLFLGDYRSYIARLFISILGDYRIIRKAISWWSVAFPYESFFLYFKGCFKYLFFFFCNYEHGDMDGTHFSDVRDACLASFSQWEQIGWSNISERNPNIILNNSNLISALVN